MENEKPEFLIKKEIYKKKYLELILNFIEHNTPPLSYDNEISKEKVEQLQELFVGFMVTACIDALQINSEYYSTNNFTETEFLIQFKNDNSFLKKKMEVFSKFFNTDAWGNHIVNYAGNLLIDNTNVLFRKFYFHIVKPEVLKIQSAKPKLENLTFKQVWLLMNEFKMFDSIEYNNLDDSQKSKLLGYILNLNNEGIRQDLSYIHDFIKIKNNKTKITNLVNKVKLTK